MAKRGKYAGYEALDPFFEVIQEGLMDSLAAWTALNPRRSVVS